MHYKTSVTKLIVSLAITLGLILPFHSPLHAQGCDELYPSPHQRIGYNVTRELNKTISDYDAARLGAGWYLDYATQVNPARPNGMDYAQMIRATNPPPTREQLDTRVGAVIDANPGALWILGNEPDRQGQQDSVTTTEYATFYHDVYQYIKNRDPNSQIAIAGVIQPTPLRLLYLSNVLSEYERMYGEAMPIDVWTTHAFILREQRPPPADQPQDVDGNWGAGIPTGLTGSDELGKLYDVDEHNNLQIFKDQLVALRQWMADNGQRDKELLVTEYGILFPEIFAGFTPEETRDFMIDTFDYMLDATDDQIGYPADGNRLVQRFSWFSLNSPGAFHPQNTGNFFDHSLFDNETFEIEFMGLAFEEYVAARTTEFADTVDLVIEDVQVTPSAVVTPTANEMVTVTVTLKNEGNVDAQNVVLRLWDGAPYSQPNVLAVSSAIASVAPSCNGKTTVSFQWQPSTTGTSTIPEPKFYNLTVDVQADNMNLDSNPLNNQSSRLFPFGLSVNNLFLPLIELVSK